ncbi:fungal-specific transcription factor domain-containing protein [Delphinella strobiligena]|nr:fungal-specific transcription factor domain-containing protein [Delphinella strobiligena]
MYSQCDGNCGRLIRDVLCRKRKSKCDGNTPSCAACSQVYGTECIYDPNSDHRRKGVYRKDVDSLKTRNSTLQTLIQAILNYAEEDVPALVRDIRTCESLDDIAERILARDNGVEIKEEPELELEFDATAISQQPTPLFEKQLSTKVGELRLDDGSVRYIGATSNLLFLTPDHDAANPAHIDPYQQQQNPVTSWTNVTSDTDLVIHLINMYFTWHYTYFTCLSKSLFYRDFSLGKPPSDTRRKTEYCTPLLVNAILALGCHFTSFPAARENPHDSATAGDHFFREAKRLIMENDEHEKPKITTVQALALISVREAGCGREAKGWVYSGMSFRMACDMGLNLNSGRLARSVASAGEHSIDEGEDDARRITFWGCFLFDKCWSNYLGRLPQLPTSLITVPKFDVFPDEDSASWVPYTDSGFMQSRSQPARTRAVALQIAALCEISNDLLLFFYNPSNMEKQRGKQAELKMLSEIHTRLETWRRDLPAEMEPKEGCLSSVLTMHMFFQILFIHLFRPFLKYNQQTSPLPQNVSPRRLCTQAAATISKLMRLYKRSHGLRQICNVCVYIIHSACTIHLLNLPDKNARRDIIHGIKHLEEIAEGWLGARKTLAILALTAQKWNIEMPEEAATVFTRIEAKLGQYPSEASSPEAIQQRRTSALLLEQVRANIVQQQQQHQQQQHQQQQQQHQNQQQHQSWTQPTNVQQQRQQTVRPAAASTAYFGPPDYAPQASAGFTLPPRSATELRPQSYPSAQSSPLAGRVKQNSTDSIAQISATGASPSDMFGGVEQLLRDGHDWVFQDQSQIATGFENWGGFDLSAAGLGQSPITSGNTPNNTTSYSSTNGYANMSNMNNNNNNNNNNSNTRGPSNGVGSGFGNDINPAGFDSMTTYDEQEWYQ